jgi:hypothetical protein
MCHRVPLKALGRIGVIDSGHLGAKGCVILKNPRHGFSIYAVEEDSFELDPDTEEVISTEGTWRARTANELGELAIPALTMSGTFY